MELIKLLKLELEIDVAEDGKTCGPCKYRTNHSDKSDYCELFRGKIFAVGPGAVRLPRCMLTSDQDFAAEWDPEND